VEEPAFVVSLGTGRARTDPEANERDHNGILKDTFFVRGFRAFWESMRGERDWQALTSFGRPKSSGKYHCFNITFDSAEPLLDDISSFAELELKTMTDPSVLEMLDTVVHAAVASLFYFELDAIPLRNDGGFMISGKIRCRLSQEDDGLAPLLDRLQHNSSRIVVNDAQSFEFRCSALRVNRSHKFQIPITFNGADMFSICLSTPFKRADISGSPFVLSKLIEAQKELFFCKRRSSIDSESPLPKRQKID